MLEVTGAAELELVAGEGAVAVGIALRLVTTPISAGDKQVWLWVFGTSHHRVVPEDGDSNTCSIRCSVVRCVVVRIVEPCANHPRVLPELIDCQSLGSDGVVETQKILCCDQSPVSVNPTPIYVLLQ